MISIVIPLYNKAAVICRTMESVKQQIFSDFEILIVNDGSTDDSLSVLMDFLSENEAVFKNSVRLIEQENKGVSAARNQGIKEARGEIIAFLDADDEWLPDYLKTIAFLVEKYPECDIFGTAYSFKMNNMITPASIDYYSFKENEGILIIILRWPQKREDLFGLQLWLFEKRLFYLLVVSLRAFL